MFCLEVFKGSISCRTGLALLVGGSRHTVVAFLVNLSAVLSFYLDLDGILDKIE